MVSTKRSTAKGWDPLNGSRGHHLRRRRPVAGRASGRGGGVRNRTQPGMARRFATSASICAMQRRHFAPPGVDALAQPRAPGAAAAGQSGASRRARLFRWQGDRTSLDVIGLPRYAARSEKRRPCRLWSISDYHHHGLTPRPGDGSLRRRYDRRDPVRRSQALCRSSALATFPANEGQGAAFAPSVACVAPPLAGYCGKLSPMHQERT